MERFSNKTWVRLSQVSLKMTPAMTKHLRRWDLSLAHFDVLVQ